MRRSQPNKLHDELDALLDGRPVELTDELAPLAEAAEALRAELAAHQLDPAVADRHLERVLGGPANVVRMPSRPQPNGWDVRRRVAAVVLAAALVLAPATMASAAALPGQPMYPFKLAIEQLRLASVQWSPSREAGERTRVANERLAEVNSLLELRMFNQLPTALNAFKQAVLEAQQAVLKASEQGEPVGEVAARLESVKQAAGQMVQKVTATTNGSVVLPPGTRDAIQVAVQQTQTVLPPPPPPEAPSGGATGTGTGTATSATSSAPATQASQSTASTASTLAPTTTTPPETSTTEAATTTAPPTTPSTTTAPSTSTEDTAAPGSLGAGAGAGGDQGSDDQASLQVAAPTTTSGP